MDHFDPLLSKTEAAVEEREDLSSPSARLVRLPSPDSNPRPALAGACTPAKASRLHVTEGRSTSATAAHHPLLPHLTRRLRSVPGWQGPSSAPITPQCGEADTARY